MSEQVNILGPKDVGAARLPPPLPKPFSNILKTPNQSLPSAASTRPAKLVGPPTNMSRMPPPIPQPLNRSTPVAPPQAATTPARVLPQPPAPGSVKQQSAADIAKRFVPNASPLPNQHLAHTPGLLSKIAARLSKVPKAISQPGGLASVIPNDAGKDYINPALKKIGADKVLNIPGSGENADSTVVSDIPQQGSTPLPFAVKRTEVSPPAPSIVTREIQPQAAQTPTQTPTGDTRGLTPIPLRPARDPSKENREVPMRPKPPAAATAPTAPISPPATPPTAQQPAAAAQPTIKPPKPDAPTPGPAATPATPPGDGAARTQARDAAAARTPMAPKPPASEKKSSGDKPIPGSEGGSFAGQPDWAKKAFSGGGNG